MKGHQENHKLLCNEETNMEALETPEYTYYVFPRILFECS